MSADLRSRAKVDTTEGMSAGGVSAPQRRRPSGLDEVQYLLSSALVVLAVATLGLGFSLVVLSRFEEHAAQTRAFDHLRDQLANGVAPVGQVDSKGRLLGLGTPVALIVIPAIHLNEVVLEGTTSGVLMSGVGHLRDTVLPGQAGTSVILGRSAAYGGPFGGVHRLRIGDKIMVTTGIGASTFKVIDLRRAGDPVPSPVAQGGGRLTLVTATGWAFLPTGVLHVDADLVGSAQSTPSLALTSVPHSELAMASDTGNLWGLVFALQALIALSAVSVWSWRRWGRVRTWVVFFPTLSLAAYYFSGAVTRLLPNLL